MNFPCAIEVLYKEELEKLKQEMLAYSWRGFVDINNHSKKLTTYLESKGFEVVEIRYETIGGKYGYHGKKTGDGIIMKRVIWGDYEASLRWKT